MGLVRLFGVCSLVQLQLHAVPVSDHRNFSKHGYGSGPKLGLQPVSGGLLRSQWVLIYLDKRTITFTVTVTNATTTINDIASPNIITTFELVQYSYYSNNYYDRDYVTRIIVAIIKINIKTVPLLLLLQLHTAHTMSSITTNTTQLRLLLVLQLDPDYLASITSNSTIKTTTATTMLWLILSYINLHPTCILFQLLLNLLCICPSCWVFSRFLCCAYNCETLLSILFW